MSPACIDCDTPLVDWTCPNGCQADAQTDRERLTALLQAFGVTSVGDSTNVVLTAKETPRVEGYTGFYVHFEFDSSGKFKTVGVWE